MFIANSSWTDPDGAYNGLDIGLGTDSKLYYPVHVSDCYFSGEARSDGSATGNKAITIQNINYPRGVRVPNVTTEGWTSAPAIDNKDTDPNVVINGTIERGSTPSASEYGSEFAGVNIIDKSSTADPYDRYTVLQDGNLDGPY